MACRLISSIVIPITVCNTCFSWPASLFSIYALESSIYEGGSIYNGNTLITQPTGALEFYTLYGTRDQGLTFSMVDRILFYLSYLLSYRLLIKVYIYTLHMNSS